MNGNSGKIFALVWAVLAGAGLVVAGNLLSINVIQWWGYIVGWTSVLFLVIAVLQSGDDDKPWTWNNRSGDDAGAAGVPVRSR